jgi:hypothetical protein
MSSCLRLHWKMAVFLMFLPLGGCASAVAPAVGIHPTMTASQTVHRSVTVPNHVLTWLTIGEDGGTYDVTPTQVAGWVDYTMTTPPLSLLAKLAGMHTLIYSDPNRVNPQSLIWNDDETTFAHDCTGKRITVSGSNDLQMNVYSHHLWSLWENDVTQREQWDGGGDYDYAFEDSADEVNPERLSAMPCNFDQWNWTAQTVQMDKTLTFPIFFNGLGLIPPKQRSPGPAVYLAPTTDGGMSEDCYAGRTPSGYFYAPHWQATANTELQMQQYGKLFACHSDAYVEADTNTALRTYFYASFLLTYDLSDQMVMTEFLTPSGVSVMPEVQLVPESPVLPTPKTIGGLLLRSGVYGREYNSCYLAGNLIGPCAVAVNPNNPSDSGPLNFPWVGKYKHTLSMSGSGVYDGGTVGVDGPAPPATMAGGVGVIALP